MPFASESQPVEVRVFVYRFFPKTAAYLVFGFSEMAAKGSSVSCPLVDISHMKQANKPLASLRISRYKS